MSAAVYTRYELLRAIRNRRVIIFALAFPVILFLAIAAPNRDVTTSRAPASRCRSTSWSAWPPSRR